MIHLFALLSFISLSASLIAHADDYPVLATYAFECDVSGLSHVSFKLDKVRAEYQNIEFYGSDNGIDGFTLGKDQKVLATLSDLSGQEKLKISINKFIGPDAYNWNCIANLTINYSVNATANSATVNAQLGKDGYCPNSWDKPETVRGSCKIQQQSPQVASRPAYGLPGLPGSK